jgi:hypothetical protein
MPILDPRNPDAPFYPTPSVPGITPAPIPTPTVIPPAAVMPMQFQAALSAYPHLFPPPGFVQFDRNGLQAPAAIGVTPIATIAINSGYRGWVRQIGLESGDFGTSFFTINLGGAPIRDYTRIEVPLGSPTTPKDVFIEIPPNFSLVLTVTCTAPTPVRWNLWGWYYPEGGTR